MMKNLYKNGIGYRRYHDIRAVFWNKHGSLKTEKSIWFFRHIQTAGDDISI
jgi:hypothetical protein